MIPDPDAMLLIIERMEQTAHQLGWDQPAVLGAVYGRGGEHVHDYEAFPFPLQPADLDDEPAQGLLTLANMMLKSTTYATGKRSSNPAWGRAVDGFAAVWFVSEAYMRRSDMPDPLGLRGRRFADMPGSVEMRYAVMIDCAGRLYFVDRVRGQWPNKTMVDVDEQSMRVNGNVVDGLRRTVLALGAAMSSGAVDLEAVGRIGQDSPTIPRL